MSWSGYVLFPGGRRGMVGGTESLMAVWVQFVPCCAGVVVEVLWLIVAVVVVVIAVALQ